MPFLCFVDVGTQLEKLKWIGEAVRRSMLTPRLGSSAERNLCWLLALMCVLAPTGCGSKSGAKAHLQGNVTLNGKAIPDDATAFVVFAPEGKGADTVSVPITKGRYDSSGIPRGDLKVFFQITRPVGPMKKSEHTGQSFQDIANLVPDKYATGIPLKVDGDDPNRDFPLTN